MANKEKNTQGLWGKFRSIPNDNALKTIFITIVISLIASLFVTFSAITLRPIQQVNKINEKRINIIRVAGLYDADKTINEMFANIEPRVIDLRTGKFTTDVGIDFNKKLALRDNKLSKKLDKFDDTALIRRQSFYQVVYLVKDENGKYEQVILPIHGYGLWSTLYGFIGVNRDGNTIEGLRFYSHAETPGLGGEVDNPLWQKKWVGKKIYNGNGEVAISVGKKNSASIYEVDALSGATLTSRGVNNLVRFWVGKNGFNSFLKSISTEGLK